MASERNKYETLLLMLVIGIPMIASTNIDCNGKSFHCVNSTHFMICVDLGGGVSTTVDNYVIPCPPPTSCKGTNYFECEIPISSTLAPTVQSFMSPTEHMATTLEWEQIFMTSRNTGADQHLELTTVQPITVVPEPNLISDPVIIQDDPVTIPKNVTMENITDPIIWHNGLSLTDSAINEVIIGNTTTADANPTSWESLAKNDPTSSSSIIEIVTGQTTTNFTELRITDVTEPNIFYSTLKPTDNSNFLLNESNSINKTQLVDIASITTMENINLQINKSPVAATENSQNSEISNVTVNLENDFEITTVTTLHDANKPLDETDAFNTTNVDSKVVTNKIINGTDLKTISKFPSAVVTKVVTSTESSDFNKTANFNTTGQTITTKIETSNLYVSETISPTITSININTTTSTYDKEDPINENITFRDLSNSHSLNESSDSTYTTKSPQINVNEGNDTIFPTTTSTLNELDMNNMSSTSVNITGNKMVSNETGKDTSLFDGSKLTTTNNIMTTQHNSSNDKMTENKTVFEGLNQQTLFNDVENDLYHGLASTEAYSETETPKVNSSEGVAVNYFTTTTDNILKESSTPYVDTSTYNSDNIVKMSTKNDAELSYAELYTSSPLISPTGAASSINYEKEFTDQKITVDTNTEVLHPFTTLETPNENIKFMITTLSMPMKENNIKSEVVTDVYSSKKIEMKESDATTKFTTILDSANTDIAASATVSTVSSLSFDINTTKQTDIPTTSDSNVYSKINDKSAQYVMTTTESEFSVKAFTIPKTTRNQVMQINESNIVMSELLELTTAKSSNLNIGDLPNNMTSDTLIIKDIVVTSSMEPVSILQSPRTEASVGTDKTIDTSIKNNEESNLNISGVIGMQKFSVADDNTDMHITNNTDATTKLEYIPAIEESTFSLFTTLDPQKVEEPQKNKTVSNKVTSTNDKTTINKSDNDLDNATNPFENLLLNNTMVLLTSEQKLKRDTNITQEPVSTLSSSTYSNRYNVTSITREMLFNNVPSYFTALPLKNRDQLEVNNLRFSSTQDTTEREKITLEFNPLVESSSVTETINSSTNSSNMQNEYDVNITKDVAMKNSTKTIFVTTNIAEADEMKLPRYSTTTGKVQFNSLPSSKLSSVTKNVADSNITKHIPILKTSSATEDTLVNHGIVMVDNSTTILQASYDTTTETGDVLSNSLPSIISLTTDTFSILKNKYEVNATTTPLSAAETTLLNHSNIEVNKLKLGLPASHITTTKTEDMLSKKNTSVELSFVTETNNTVLNSSDKQNLYVNNRTKDIVRNISGADEITPVKHIRPYESGFMSLASHNTTIKKGKELSNNTPLIDLSFTTEGRNLLNESSNTQNKEVNITRDDLITKTSNRVDNAWLNHDMVNNSFSGFPVYRDASTVNEKVFSEVKIMSTTEVDSILKNTTDAQTAYEVNIRTNNVVTKSFSDASTIAINNMTSTVTEKMLGDTLIPDELNLTTKPNKILINSSKMQPSDNNVTTKPPFSGIIPTVSNFGDDAVSSINDVVSTKKTSEVFPNNLSSIGMRTSANEESIRPTDPSKVIITSSSSGDTSVIKPDSINNRLSTTSPDKQEIENTTFLRFTKTTRPVVNGNYNITRNPFVISSTTTAHKGQQELLTNNENQYEHSTDNIMHSTDTAHFIIGQTVPLSVTLPAQGLATRKAMTPSSVTAAANPTTWATPGHFSPLPQNSSVESNPLQKSFNCKVRGRYSDKHDCRKFYICNGSQHVITGLCPFNTVFSEIKKLCTKNLSHCIRENQFHCVSAGRFSDFWKANVFYICVKNGDAFLRYKLQCQDGYFLNKTTLRCYQHPESSNVSISYDNSQSTTERKVERKRMRNKNKKEEFICEKEGKFPYSDDSRKYYVCSKRDRSNEFKVRVKKCDSDEIFHKKKRRCVDASSYERS